MKKFISILLTFMLALSVVACSNGKASNVEGNLTDIMAKVYEGVEAPMLVQPEVNSENLSYYLGVESLDYKEVLASEAAINAIAHSVVLVRVNDGVDVEKAKTEIKEKVDPRKWLCVGVEEDNVIVDSIGDLIILIMDNENSEALHKNFQNLAK